jgi:hypothetical protein
VTVEGPLSKSGLFFETALSQPTVNYFAQKLEMRIYFLLEIVPWRQDVGIHDLFDVTSSCPQKVKYTSAIEHNTLGERDVLPLR